MRMCGEMAMPRITVEQWYEATMARGIRQGSCLLWPGSLTHNGYGRTRVPPELAEVLGIKPRTPALVHRAIFAYHNFLPDFLKTGIHMHSDPIDHDHTLCSSSACYRLLHLRHVSHAVNQRRALEVRKYGRPPIDEWAEEPSDWF